MDDDSPAHRKSIQTFLASAVMELSTRSATAVGSEYPNALIDSIRAAGSGGTSSVSGWGVKAGAGWTGIVRVGDPCGARPEGQVQTDAVHRTRNMATRGS